MGIIDVHSSGEGVVEDAGAFTNEALVVGLRMLPFHRLNPTGHMGICVSCSRQLPFNRLYILPNSSYPSVPPVHTHQISSSIRIFNNASLAPGVGLPAVFNGHTLILLQG